MDSTGRRREPRRTMTMYLDCISAKDSQETGKIVDITPGGMMLLTDRRIESGAEDDYTIIIPPSLPDSQHPLQVRAKCAWSRAAELHAHWYIGMQFIEPGMILSRRIGELIDQLGFSDGQKKIFSDPGGTRYF